MTEQTHPLSGKLFMLLLSAPSVGPPLSVLRTMSEFWYIPAVLRLSTTWPIARSTLVAIAATLFRCSDTSVMLAQYAGKLDCGVDRLMWTRSINKQKPDGLP